MEAQVALRLLRGCVCAQAADEHSAAAWCGAELDLCHASLSPVRFSENRLWSRGARSTGTKRDALAFKHRRLAVVASGATFASAHRVALAPVPHHETRAPNS